MKVKDGIIVGENGTYGKVSDADIVDNCIITVSEGMTDVFPLTGEWGDWSEVVAEWNEMYPNGKPKPEPVPAEPTLTESERIALLEQAMNAIIGGV